MAKSLNINKIRDREKLKGMIKNQINTLNKKIKSFEQKGISEHYDFIESYLNEDMVQFNENGRISKAMGFYDDKNLIWLKKTLSALHKINNNDMYGTVNKYEKMMNTQIGHIKDSIEQVLRNKGYSEQFILEVTSSKGFYASLFMSFNESVGYESHQTIEKIALNYGNSGLGKREINKIISNIEHSRNTNMRILEENEALQEFKRLRSMR